MNSKFTYAIAVYSIATIVGVGGLLSATNAVTAKSTVTPTPDASAAATPADQNIEQLKERLATKVAQLQTEVKRAMFGTVKSVSVASATVETPTKDIKIELGDNVSVAQMISGKRSSLTTDNISVGDPITVFGTYDATLDLLKAQYIFIESKVTTQHVAGTVTDIDTKGFTVTVSTAEGRTQIVDIERSTKTSSWTKDGGIVKSGFSKIAAGDVIHVAGTIETKQPDHISAIRILDLGNITGAAPSPTPTITPEASPSATPEPTAKPRKVTPTP